MIESILIATDGSDAAHVAERYGARLAGKLRVRCYPAQHAFLLALNKSLQALHYPINPYPHAVTASAPPGAYIGDLDGAIRNFLTGPHNHAAGLPASTPAQPQPLLLPLNTPRLWLFLALLADPQTKPLIGPRCGLMTISPASMRRVFRRLANKEFPASSNKHNPLRTTPLAAITRTPFAPALTNITARSYNPPMLAPVPAMLTESTYNYIDARAKAVGESRARTAGILAHWALTMNPPAPPPRKRARSRQVGRSSNDYRNLGSANPGRLPGLAPVPLGGSLPGADRLFFWADVLAAQQVSLGHPLRENAFMESLTDSQRRQLANAKAADLALDQSWRRKRKS